jgi:6-phosphogluconolactonase (cycloisomerase 2 family)
MAKTVYYAGTGAELTLYDLDVDGAALTKRGTVTLPANIQYAWPHPSRRYLYVVSSNGGPGLVGDKHFANALTVEPATGALKVHGEPAALPSRPIHASVDHSGEFLLVTYNNPSHVTVHRINADGTIGAEVKQAAKLDTGIYAHQILAVPSNKTVLLVTRGNDAKSDKPEDPGAIKTFSFSDGALSNLASTAPGTGLGFGPRHLDFHPTKPWVFVSIERQNQIHIYERNDTTGLAPDPIFVKNSLANPKPPVRQAAGAIHVHPNGRFVYQTNRASDLTTQDGETTVIDGENNVAVYAIDQVTGEPALIQNADGRAYELRTFGIDPAGKLLIAASIKSVPVRDGSKIKTVPARISVFRIANDGKLELARQYDVDTSKGQQFWTGVVTLP